MKLMSFSLPSTGGNFADLKSLKGKWTLLFFYPRDLTPGCTIEAREFSDLKKQFESLGIQVFGVSRDSLASHEKFKTKENYTVELLSDSESILCNQLDVIKEKNMYGKKVKGIQRSTFLIGPEATVIAEWRGVKAEGHAKMVLSEIKEKHLTQSLTKESNK